MIRAVVFDRDGTLLRERKGEEVLQEILRPLGFDLAPEALRQAEGAARLRWRQKYQGLPRGHRWNREVRRDCLAASLESLHLPGDQEDLLRRLDENWDAFRVVGVFAGVMPCLGALASARIPMGVLATSMRSSPELRSDLEKLGIGRYLRFVASVEETEWDVPDPKLFLWLAEQFGLPPSQVLFVGDDPAKDIVGARAAGLVPVLVDRRGTAAPDGVTVVRTLAALPALLLTLA